ncbi:hypothetical protein AAV94_09710 [Lampropedia cohaerens]|uniref:Ammonium transporter AmtB-like domain-containing protein n=2 Tax=Lampropedia cohaerens TaxID=1610491 RepID=A0A0U1PYQ6_9BURK|nr:hypothetical protein AAV94_09710 [Lampropedia cohaerens]
MGFVMGFVAGVACFNAIGVCKHHLGYDDSFDTFGLHGMGGSVGSLLTGVFASTSLGGFEDIAITNQLWIQFKSVVFTILYYSIATFAILKVVGLLTGGLRVEPEVEQIGLDSGEHNERAYNL